MSRGALRSEHWPHSPVLASVPSFTMHKAIELLLSANLSHDLVDPVVGLVPVKHRPAPVLVLALLNLRPAVASRVRASEAEGGHAIDLALLQRARQLVDEEDGVLIDVQVRVEGPEVRVRGREAVVQHQHDLEERASARVRLLVPHMCLGGAVHHRLVAVPEHNAPIRTHLDGVAQGGPRAMALPEHDLPWPEVRLTQGLPDALLLRGSGRGGQAGAPAVLVHTAAQHRGQGPVGGVGPVVVVVDAEVGAATALPPDEAIRAGVEGEAPPSKRQHSGSALADPTARTHHGEDAKANPVIQLVIRRLVREGYLVLPPVGKSSHHVATRVGRHERCRAGRVHRNVRPREVQARCKPSACDRIQVAGIHVLVLLPIDSVPLTTGIPDEGANALTQQILLRPASLVECLVTHLHDPALRGRDGLGLLLRDAKELVVETEEEVVRDERPVHDVRLAIEDGVPVLHDVEVLVEAGEGHLAQGVGAQREHGERLLAVLAICGKPLRARSQAYPFDALDARWSGELVELYLLRGIHQPHLQGNTVPLWLVRVAHQVVPEDDHP
mmetsp:Transcript_42859/g.128065  ORF Transcript_42859/g.128065 Transcript_42859/m.128065 type:complete len:555 (+) Transcript_42859:83-1747(+)